MSVSMLSGGHFVSVIWVTLELPITKSTSADEVFTTLSVTRENASSRLVVSCSSALPSSRVLVDIRKAVGILSWIGSDNEGALVGGDKTKLSSTKISKGAGS